MHNQQTLKIYRDGQLDYWQTDKPAMRAKLISFNGKPDYECIREHCERPQTTSYYHKTGVRIAPPVAMLAR